MNANIMQPSYYRQTKLEPIEVITAWQLDFNLGNVIKYVGRFERKGGRRQQRIRDLMKAMYYMQRAMMSYADTEALLDEVQDWIKSEDQLLTQLRTEIDHNLRSLKNDA